MGVKDSQRLSIAVCNGSKIKAATAYEEALATNNVDHDGVGMIVLLVFGSWIRFSVEDTANFGTLCGSDESIIGLLNLVKKKGFAVMCLTVYPRLVEERREKQPIPRKHARDDPATNPMSRKSKKQQQSTSARPYIINTESIPAVQEISGPQDLPSHPEPINDTNTYGAAKDWLGERERDQSQVLNSLTWLGRVQTPSLESSLANCATLPLDSNLNDYATLPLDSNLIELVPMNNNETQLPIPNNWNTQFLDFSPSVPRDTGCQKLSVLVIQNKLELCPWYLCLFGPLQSNFATLIDPQRV